MEVCEELGEVPLFGVDELHVVLEQGYGGPFVGHEPVGLGVEGVEVGGMGLDVGLGEVVASAERAGVVDFEETPHERLVFTLFVAGVECVDVPDGHGGASFMVPVGHFGVRACAVSRFAGVLAPGVSVWDPSGALISENGPVGPLWGMIGDGPGPVVTGWPVRVPSQ